MLKKAYFNEESKIKFGLMATIDQSTKSSKDQNNSIQ